MRNGKAVGSVLVGLLALTALAAGVAANVLVDEVGVVETVGAIPLAALLGLLALSLGGHGRMASRRSLGRLGGEGIAVFGRFLGGLTLLLALTGALAVGVYAVLVVFG